MLQNYEKLQTLQKLELVSYETTKDYEHYKN